MHRKYDLRPRKKVVNQDSHPKPKKSNPSLSMDKVKKLKNTIKVKEVGETSKEEKEVMELEESVSSFNFEKELSKIKILVPLAKLDKHPAYQNHMKKL